jgi:hypothetical protein
LLRLSAAKSKPVGNKTGWLGLVGGMTNKNTIAAFNGMGSMTDGGPRETA